MVIMKGEELILVAYLGAGIGTYITHQLLSTYLHIQQS